MNYESSDSDAASVREMNTLYLKRPTSIVLSGAPAQSRLHLLQGN